MGRGARTGPLDPIFLMCTLRLSAFPTRAPSPHPFEVCAWVGGGHLRPMVVCECSGAHKGCFPWMVGGLFSTPLLLTMPLLEMDPIC